jgi:sugar/nucleoside kinase (ribokinase family)
MEYLVGGYTMVNDIVLADGSIMDNKLGGSVFAAAGIKLWRDSLVYVGVAGSDFSDIYGEYFRANGIVTGVNEAIPSTLRYVLKHNPDGSWNEYCKLDPEATASAAKASALTIDMFAPYCDVDTKGIYLEAPVDSEIANSFAKLKSLMPNGRIMWEIMTADLMSPKKRDKVLEKIGQADIYSMNFNEARAFFGVNSIEEATNALLDLGKPCFFRAGATGAYMIQNGRVAFLASVGTENTIDPTGCGNNSTAAALVAFAEGLSMRETLAMANISASYNARQYGPWPLLTPQVRREAEDMLDRLLRGK